MIKKPFMIKIEDVEKDKVKRLSVLWGASMAGVIRRLIREYKEND